MRLAHCCSRPCEALNNGTTRRIAKEKERATEKYLLFWLPS